MQAFFFLEYCKTHTENFQFSDQHHELTPLEKSQFLNILIV